MNFYYKLRNIEQLKIIIISVFIYTLASVVYWTIKLWLNANVLRNNIPRIDSQITVRMYIIYVALVIAMILIWVGFKRVKDIYILLAAIPYVTIVLINFSPAGNITCAILCVGSFLYPRIKKRHPEIENDAIYLKQLMGIIYGGYAVFMIGILWNAIFNFESTLIDVNLAIPWIAFLSFVVAPILMILSILKKNSIMSKLASGIFILGYVAFLLTETLMLELMYFVFPEILLSLYVLLFIQDRRTMLE